MKTAKGRGKTKPVPHVCGMPKGQVGDDGAEITFNLKTTDGRAYSFRASTDAIDIMMSNLESLAIRALNRRRELRTERHSVPPELPPLHSCASWYGVEESKPSDPWQGLRLVIERYDRPPIHIPLVQESYEQFVQALKDGPKGTPAVKH